MPLTTEPKIDCHAHILDPAQFPYTPGNPYLPSGQEIAPVAQFDQVLATFGVRGALLVQPNSGYGADNRCLLSALASSGGRFKGVAVVPHETEIADLARLQSHGIVGVAFNPSFHGVDYYRETASLLDKLADLGMFLQLQVHERQLLDVLPFIARSKVRLMIDHCGRPLVSAGLRDPAFEALLDLGRSGRAGIKLSGYGKFSDEAHPFQDTWPFVRALVDAFTLDACVWASDWPFLRAPQRVDYGPLLTLAEHLFPDAGDRRKIFWDTPRKLFGFSDLAET